MKNTSLIQLSVNNTFMKNKKKVLLLIASLIGSVVFSLIPPQILRLIIDDHLSTGVMKGLKLLALFYLAAAVLCGLCDFTKGAMLTDLGQRMIKNIRLVMMEKMHRLPSEYFAKNSIGSITGRFNNDVEHVDSLFSDGAIGLLVDSLKMAGIVISIAMFSLKLGTMVLILIPLIYIMTRAFQKYMLKAQHDNLSELGGMNEHLEDSVRNIRTIKTYNRENWLYEKYKSLLEKNFYTVRKVNFCDAVYSPIIQVIKAVVIVLIVYSASGHTAFTGITVGMTAASIDLITNLFGPIESLGTEFQNIQDGVSAIDRINLFGREKEDKKDDTMTVRSILDGHADDEPILRADHVSFSYDIDRGQVLYEINF